MSACPWPAILAADARRTTLRRKVPIHSAGSLSVCLTYHAFSRERPPGANGRAARRLPATIDDAICSRRDAVHVRDAAGASAPGLRTALVGCYAGLDGGKYGVRDDSSGSSEWRPNSRTAERTKLVPPADTSKSASSISSFLPSAVRSETYERNPSAISKVITSRQ